MANSSTSKQYLGKQYLGYLPEHSFLMAKKQRHQSTHDSSSFKPIFEAGQGFLVIAKGNPKAELAFVCETATEEWEAGGKLLDKMLEAMGTQRKEVYLAQVVLPPQSEPNSIREGSALLATETAFGILDREFSSIQVGNQSFHQSTKPKVIVALGKFAAANLLKTEASFEQLRRVVHPYHQHKLIVTFHPDELLTNIPAKKDCWEDLKIVLRELGWKK